MYTFHNKMSTINMLYTQKTKKPRSVPDRPCRSMSSACPCQSVFLLSTNSTALSNNSSRPRRMPSTVGRLPIGIIHPQAAEGGHPVCFVQHRLSLYDRRSGMYLKN